MIDKLENKAIVPKPPPKPAVLCPKCRKPARSKIGVITEGVRSDVYVCDTCGKTSVPVPADA